MKKERYKRIYVVPAFYRKIEKERIEKGYPTLIDFTRDIAKDERNLSELWVKKKPQKKERGYNFGL